MIKSLKNIFKTKTVQRIQNNKQLRGGIILFVVSIAAFIASAALFPSPQRANNQLPAELQEIDKSIKEARNKTDPFVREYFIQQEARKLKLTTDEYKKLYALRKQESEILPDAPGSWVEKAKWFYPGLSREQRFKVIGIWGVRIIQGFSSLAILFGVGRFLWEIPRREKEAKYQAWQVVHTAHGQKVSGARIAALEDLHEQRESLAGLTLEEGANLYGINLPKVDLMGANLNGAKLTFANLISAHLMGANLHGANLHGANLHGADLNFANLTFADLMDANLMDANLMCADLSGANLRNANLRNADLRGVDLRGAKLINTDISGAKLNSAKLFNMNLSQTVVEQAKFSRGSGLTEAQERDLQQRGAIFDVTITPIDPPLSP